MDSKPITLDVPPEPARGAIGIDCNGVAWQRGERLWIPALGGSLVFPTGRSWPSLLLEKAPFRIVWPGPEAAEETPDLRQWEIRFEAETGTLYLRVGGSRRLALQRVPAGEADVILDGQGQVIGFDVTHFRPPTALPAPFTTAERAEFAPAAVVETADPMPDAAALLDQLTGSTVYANGAEYSADTIEPRTFAALRAVLAVHRQHESLDRTCVGCSDRGETYDDVPWPCPTVRAVVEALSLDVS